MKVTFLGSGTSQGVPVIACSCAVCKSLDYRDNRLRASIHIEIEDKSFIIDSGPDFRQQVLRNNIQKLDALIFTHEHKDHTAGMDDIRSFNHKYDKDMPIYGRDSVLEQLKREFEYIFKPIVYPGVPRVILHTITNSAFDIEGVTFMPIEVMHYKLPVFGFRIGDFTYITDANYIAPEEIEKIKGSKILVINALHKNDHISHYSLPQALAVIAEINPETAYLTHISHSMGLHRLVEKELPKNVFIAYDGLQLKC